jgi:hypothetical protein
MNAHETRQGLELNDLNQVFVLVDDISTFDENIKRKAEVFYTLAMKLV